MEQDRRWMPRGRMGKGARDIEVARFEVESAQVAAGEVWVDVDGTHNVQGGVRVSSAEDSTAHGPKALQNGRYDGVVHWRGE